MNADFLCHHGIKGQKWGVRRYQNQDGSLTDEGRKRAALRTRVSKNIKTTDAANEIVRTLSDKEKQLLGASLHEDWVEKEHELETSANLTKRIIHEKGNIPISMFEIWDDGGPNGQIAIATRSGDKYRGHGNAAKAAQKGLDWYNKYGKKKMENLYWIAEKSNKGSIRLAERLGFEQLGPDRAPYKDEDYVYYRYKQ